MTTMTTKSDICLPKIGVDEPIFVLRAQDTLAAEIVRQWAVRAREAGSSVYTISEALDCADAMDLWGEAHRQKVPD